MTAPDRIDPRGPRFAAAITAVLLLLDVVLALGPAPAAGTALLAALVLLFAWGAAAGVRRHPFGLLFAKAVRPRLTPPAELEDARPPTFAQAVGAVITGGGLLLALLGVAWAVPVAAALAFVAAFLNAAFGLCLGCQLYLLLARAAPAR
jgi:hypothetical protein